MPEKENSAWRVCWVHGAHSFIVRFLSCFRPGGSHVCQEWGHSACTKNALSRIMGDVLQHILHEYQQKSGQNLVIKAAYMGCLENALDTPRNSSFFTPLPSYDQINNFKSPPPKDYTDLASRCAVCTARAVHSNEDYYKHINVLHKDVREIIR